MKNHLYQRYTNQLVNKPRIKKSKHVNEKIGDQKIGINHKRMKIEIIIIKKRNPNI